MTQPPASSNPVPSPNAEKAPDKGPDKAEKNRYKATLNLPQTGFPMKANLVQNEPASLKRWNDLGLYHKIRELRKGSAPFRFHDGPPYANGSIHLGHMFNKTLKDLVVRSKTMQNLDCPYIPGWDCHGLPIEHKVMTELQEKGKLAKVMEMEEGQRKMVVRRECQQYAEKFVKLQSAQMQQLLTLGDYADPYLTMKPAYEGAVLEVLASLCDQGLVYRALKPVHWSIANETALAEAELEYMDREDPSVYVDFEADDANAVYDAFGLPAHKEDDDTEDAAPAPASDDEAPKAKVQPGVRPHARPTFMIWTTTPWTLPANLAIAVNEKYEYALVFLDGNIAVVAADAVKRIAAKAGTQDVVIIATAPGSKLVGLKYRHAFISGLPAFDALQTRSSDLSKVYTILSADYVTLEDGTGLVHTAPGHGAEDYQTGLREKLPIYCPVRADGSYDGSVPEWLRGIKVWDANPKVIQTLRDSGHMFHDHVFTHSYPHDWRSKTPTIYRCTEQWFVGVDLPKASGDGSLRSLAMQTTADTVKFVPDWGRNRMRGMLESRPDWCISRQRAWGLPIPSMVYDTSDGRTASFMTGATIRAIAKLIREKGADVWFSSAPADLLKYYDPATEPTDALRAAGRDLLANVANLRKGSDILDVWFESGSSWNAVMRERGLGYPMDLYLEGSDQHRGWFQLSLLPALGATGIPPFKTLLTHGFMVDKDGFKLSKSKGDTIEALLKDYGADVLRWWVSTLAYENDVKVDRQFYDVAGDAYRKVRNTLRFLLSNLSDFDPKSTPLNASSITPTSLEGWVLDRFDTLSREVIDCYNAYDFRNANLKLYDFCNTTLSAEYLAAVKDRLYCDKVDAPRRRRTQAALYHLTDGLCRLLAPIIPHTADEAYRALLRVDPKDTSTCIHTQTFLPPLGIAADSRWPAIMAALDTARQKLESTKASIGVDNPLDAAITLPTSVDISGFDAADLADLLGVSRVASGSDFAAISLLSEPRCERSWKRDGTVKQRSDGGMLTDRDAAAVGVT
jgi:isoleucyl-tRNA synthetase